MATFNCEDVVRTWPCGEQLKRTEPLASLGKGRGGKLILDLPKIRARQAAVGSVYVPPGPHQQESERPGLGALRAALRKLDEDSLLSSTVRDLQSLDKRMSMVTTLPKMMTGPMRSVSSGSAGLGASGLLGSSGSIPFEDYGSPVLSETQKRFSSTMRSVKTVKPCYKSRRVKLPLLRQADLLAKVMGTAAPSDTLIWVSVLADWNPVCFRIESVLETLHSGFCQDAAANRSSEGAHVKVRTNAHLCQA